MVDCEKEFSVPRILLPRIPSAKKLWLNRSSAWEASRTTTGGRRVWLMITVGSDLAMFRLHVSTLGNVVDGLLVTESQDTFTRQFKKPAYVTDALAAGVFPHELASKMHVEVVDLEKAASTGHCSGRLAGHPRTACVEAWQRYRLLGMLIRHARPLDVALLADSDEIARPSVVVHFGQTGIENHVLSDQSASARQLLSFTYIRAQLRRKACGNAFHLTPHL